MPAGAPPDPAAPPPVLDEDAVLAWVVGGAASLSGPPIIRPSHPSPGAAPARHATTTMSFDRCMLMNVA